MNRGNAWSAIAVLAAVTALASCGDSSSSTPISAQSCHQLAATMKQILHDEGPEQSFDVQRKAGQDATRVNDRTNELGGCSTAAAKAPTPTTGPSGTPGDAGVTPSTQTSYLALMQTDTSLAGLAPDALVQLGTRLCSDLDQGRSIAAEAKAFIADFEAQGLNSNDAEMSFYDVASGAAHNGAMSFCLRHAQSVDDYDQSG